MATVIKRSSPGEEGGCGLCEKEKQRECEDGCSVEYGIKHWVEVALRSERDSYILFHISTDIRRSS